MNRIYASQLASSILKATENVLVVSGSRSNDFMVLFNMATALRSRGMFPEIIVGAFNKSDANIWALAARREGLTDCMAYSIDELEKLPKSSSMPLRFGPLFRLVYLAKDALADEGRFIEVVKSLIEWANAPLFVYADVQDNKGERDVIDWCESAEIEVEYLEVEDYE